MEEETAAFREDDFLTLLEEEIRDTDGLVEQAPRIRPQVEHELLHSLLFELLEGLEHLGNRGGGEVLETDVADAGFEHEGVRDGVRLDLSPRDRHVQGLGETGTDDGDPDLGPFGPFKSLHDRVDRQVVDGFALDLVDDVAGTNPEFRPGGALDRGDDRDFAVPLGDDDPEAVRIPAASPASA